MTRLARRRHPTPPTRETAAGAIWRSRRSRHDFIAGECPLSYGGFGAREWSRLLDFHWSASNVHGRWPKATLLLLWCATAVLLGIGHGPTL